MLDWLARRFNPSYKQDKHLTEQFRRMSQPVGQVTRTGPEVDFTPILAQELRRQNCKVYKFQ